MTLENKYKYIKFENPQAGLGIITLNRPEKRNALMEDMAKEIREVLNAMTHDPNSRVLILKGEGPSFCSGWDLDVQKDDAAEIRNDASKLMFNELDTQFYSTIADINRLLWESPVVTISQVHGYAIESGMAIALHCDLVFAADDAKFFWRPVGGAGMLWHLWPWTIGLRKTKELLFEGNFVTGKEAAELGMINESVPLEELSSVVMKKAKHIASRPREFLYLDKVYVNMAYESMGLHEVCKSSAIGHILSHLTEPSTDLLEKMTKGNKKEVRKVLDNRASPYSRE